MFLQLNHQQLEIYKKAKLLVTECYFITKSFPQEEKFALSQQIRRAAISVYLNIAEGASRRSLAERKRFYEIARGSLIEVDAALEIAEGLNYRQKNEMQIAGQYLLECFKMLSAMMQPVAP
ncbi:MAG: four helix bundle protein [Flaviaesturariibacter sp.]|nr:four helix bundle protein [Flaviaesturariibacter sp.]